jgi:hypothetical protein
MQPVSTNPKGRAWTLERNMTDMRKRYADT